MSTIKPLKVNFVKKDGQRSIYSVEGCPGTFVITTDPSLIIREQFLDDIQSLPVGERVKRRRESFGMNQRDLATLSGVTQGAISIIERGESHISGVIKEKLQVALKVDSLFFDDSSVIENEHSV